MEPLLICPNCKSKDIKCGGYTGVYYWCNNCKDPYYSKARDENYAAFVFAGNLYLQSKVKD